MIEHRGEPRSGRGGRRFKSCHSDQYLAEISKYSATPCATPCAYVGFDRDKSLLDGVACQPLNFAAMGPICRLVFALGVDDQKRRAVLVLVCKLDASGTDAANPIVTMAGYVGLLSGWLDFEVRLRSPAMQRAREGRW
jgi:hypothetical protein